MKHRLGLCLLLLALVAGVVHAANLAIPEKFFFGLPQPDNKVTLTFTRPGSLDPEQVAKDDGWWNAFAKFTILVLQSGSELDKAWTAASNDLDLQKSGVTYVGWSRGTQDEKREARERVRKVVQAVVEKHRLRELLISTPVDDKLIAKERAKAEARLAEQLGITAPSTAPLIAYCPSIDSNIKMDPQNPAFPKLMAALEDPVVKEAFRSAAAEFGSYLDKHPQASVEERNAELTRLMAPVLKKVQ